MSEPNLRPGQEEEPFTLTPSIFLPFPGFPGKNAVTNQALEPTEKLQKIIENVGLQQERVRGNMMFLVKQRAERLSSKAREKIAALDTDDDESDEEKRKSINALFETLRVPAKKGAKSEDFEFMTGKNTSVGEIAASGEKEDIIMGGTQQRTTPHSPPVEPSTSTQILSTLSTDLKNLVDRGAAEMTAYDIHAKEVVAHYKSALDRRTGRKGSGTSIVKPGGGVSGGGMQNPVEMMKDVRRMSTGMPIPGMMVGGQQPVRMPEKIEDLARRGSK